MPERESVSVPAEQEAAELLQEFLRLIKLSTAAIAIESTLTLVAGITLLTATESRLALPAVVVGLGGLAIVWRNFRLIRQVDLSISSVNPE